MPTYTIRNRKNGEVVSEITMTISEMEMWEKRNPQWEVACGAPRLGYHFNRLKPDEGFRDRLRKIKSEYPNSTVNIP